MDVFVDFVLFGSLRDTQGRVDERDARRSSCFCSAGLQCA